MESKRLAVGFGWGLVATLAMSVVMVIGFTTGIAPMPAPIPEAIAARVLNGVIGAGAPQPAIMVVAVVSHFAYGGLWGAILAALSRPVTIWKGLGLGIFLWVLMQVVAFPFLGWGVFGVAITPQIAVATLILHLVYGLTLGGLMDTSKRGYLSRARTSAEPEPNS